MFKKLLLSLVLLSSTAYTNEVVSENSHLKLKLEVYELKAQITQLNNIIEKLKLAENKVYLEEQRKTSAIALLRSDLREGRRKKHDISVLLEMDGS